MASDDINDLMREVDQSLSGGRGRSRRPSRRAGSYPATSSAERRGVVAVATTSAALAAAVVFLLFALTPLLGAISGAAGAFLATFVAVLLSRLRR